MYFPKLEITTNIFSVSDLGLCVNPSNFNSLLQVTSLSLPFHLDSFGKKESFFYLGTGLKTNYFPTSAKRRTQLEALFVLVPLKQIGS